MKPMSLCLKDISIYKGYRHKDDKPLLTLDSLQDWHIFSMVDQDSVSYWFIAAVRHTLLTSAYFCIKICKAETLEWQHDLDIYVDNWNAGDD